MLFRSIEIKDKKGSENVVADHLSRISCSETRKIEDSIPGEQLMGVNASRGLTEASR